MDGLDDSCSSMMDAECIDNILAGDENLGLTSESVQKSIRSDAEREMVKVETQLLCIICLEGERASKQTWCLKCASDVRAATRDAKAQGVSAERAFKALKKLGNNEFREAMLVYRARCSGFGKGRKRLSFHWVRYEMCIRMSSHVQHGTKCLWMSRGYFVEIQMRDKEMSKSQAIQEFECQWEQLPPARKKGSGVDRALLWPMEHFVYAFNDHMQAETTSWGTKDFQWTKS